MSLLNDALRKKNNKENESSKEVSFFKKESKSSSSNNAKKYISLGVILIAGILIILGCLRIIFPQIFQSTSLEKKSVSVSKSYTGRIDPSVLPETSSAKPSNESTKPEVTPVKQDTNAQIDNNNTSPVQKEKKDKVEQLPEANHGKTEYENKTKLEKPEKIKDKENIEISQKDITKKPEFKKGLLKRSIKRKVLSKKNKDQELILVSLDKDPFYQKGIGYQNRGMFNEAIKMYQQVLNKFPRHYDTRFNLSSVFINAGAYSEANNILKRLNEENPENVEVLLNLAITEIGLERPERAIINLNKAKYLSTGSRFDIFFNTGIAQSKLKRFDEAIFNYKKAEEINPAHLRLLFNIGLSYDKMKRYDEALKYYSSFLNRNNSLPDDERKSVEERIRVLMKAR